MPLPTPVAGTFEVAVGGRDGNANFAMNIMKYLSDTPPTNLDEAFAQAFDLVNAYNTSVIPKHKLWLADDCAINLLWARHIGVGGGAAAYHNISVVGTEGSDSLSSVVATNVAWFPGTGSARPGHTYLWGVPIDAYDGAVLQGVWAGLVRDWITAVLTNLHGAVTTRTFEFVVLDRKTGNVSPQTAGNIQQKITGLNKRAKPYV